MAVDMLEKNSFYTFGREMYGYDANNEYRNFLPIMVGGAIVLGRRKKNDKTRQEIADKYQSLRLDCDGIDSSISQVSSDLSNLKSSKPRKNKDERLWKIRVEETESVLREVQSAKRKLICTKPESPSTPQTPPSDSGGNGGSVKPSDSGTKTGGGTRTGGGLFPSGSPEGGNGGGMEDSEPLKAKKSNVLLYAVLGIVAVGGIVYFIRKK